MRNKCTKNSLSLLHLLVFIVMLLNAIYFYSNLNVKAVSSTHPWKIKPNLEHEPLKVYNLMKETFGEKWNASKEYFFEYHKCTEEYANKNKLQQDHPCVLHLIRKKYIRQPAPVNLSYHLNNPRLVDPSDGQSKGILALLRNQTNGFFIECGSFDGEYLSNTLFMERSMGWNGLLVEADRKAFDQLLTRNRKSYIAPVCLSTKPYPMQVVYNTTQSSQLSSYIVEVNDFQFDAKRKKDEQGIGEFNETENVYKVQCFPLYSLMLAIGQTEIDYFSLDVEGAEYKILKTMPWQNVDIKTITVEWNHTPEGEPAITRLMKKNNFVKFGHIEMSFSREVVYVKDFFTNLRLYE